MALWNGLGQAATVAQLVGADVGGLISMIVQSALTARQNKSECELLAHRVLMIAQLLPHVQELEAAQPLAGLGDTLRDAHDLVVSCQGRGMAYQVVMAGRTAERFREVQRKIDSYLILFPVISHIGITRRLERIYSVLVPDDSTRDEPSPLQQSLQLQGSREVAQEVLLHGTQEFTLADIVGATNNFALDTKISHGGSGTVYRGRLHDGREVAIKHINSHAHGREEFTTELDMLQRLRHKHIVRLLGSCVTVSKDKRLLTTLQKKKKGLLTRWRKEPERLIIYEFMENGSLYEHLHPDQDSGTLSPLTVSWKMRIGVLLEVSRAIEHLHCHVSPPVIHRDIKPANIIFDANWMPHLSDFGVSVTCDTSSEEGLDLPVIGTIGYLDPQYFYTSILMTTSDVYSLGVVMLEVLMGKMATSQVKEGMKVGLVPFTVPMIDAGYFGELLDRRPVPEPTPTQLKALEHVAQTARCCVKLIGEDRPTISDIVANLEMAHELICRDEPGSVDELPNSPRASNVSSASYYSDLESEMLEEGVDTHR